MVSSAVNQMCDPFGVCLHRAQTAPFGGYPSEVVLVGQKITSFPSTKEGWEQSCSATGIENFSNLITANRRILLGPEACVIINFRQGQLG